MGSLYLAVLRCQIVFQTDHTMSYPMYVCLLICLGIAILSNPATAAPKPWYQGGGLGDCAPGLCPPTAEVSPVQCSSDPTLYFNNGYPTNCAEGEQCDQEVAAAGAGNPCKPAKK